MAQAGTMPEAGRDTSTYARWRAARERGEHWNAPVHTSVELFNAQYHVGAKIGRGAFGVVHRARDALTGDEVAVKTIRVHGSGPRTHPSHADFIQHEVHAMAKLSHVNIVALIEAFTPPVDAEDDEATWHLVLELCAGKDLEDILSLVGAVDPESLQVIAAQLAFAVRHMHGHGGTRAPSTPWAHGHLAHAVPGASIAPSPAPNLPCTSRGAVVHKDIKPGNLMVIGGELAGAETRIKVLDFGLAHELDDDTFEKQYRTYVTKLARSKAAFQPPTVVKQQAPPGTMKHPPAARLKLDLDASVHRRKQPKPRRSPQLVVEPSRNTFTAAPSGTRRYVAPEVVDESNWSVHSTMPRVTVNVTIDAYSIGATLLHMATGVPPGEQIATYISDHTASPLAACLALSRACAGTPSPHYKHLTQVDQDVRDIIHALMLLDPTKRMTVTQLCSTPWISGASDDGLPARVV